MANPRRLPKPELIQRFVDLATALRDQDPGITAEDLAETALAVTCRQPDYQPWGRTEPCPEEPMVDLMRRVMNGDGFHATTAGIVRVAASAQPSRHPLFDRLAMLGITPLPRDLPGDDQAHVLLYDVKRRAVLSAVRDRDDGQLGEDVAWLLRNVDRGRESYENERWYAARD